MQSLSEREKEGGREERREEGLEEAGRARYPCAPNASQEEEEAEGFIDLQQGMTEGR